MFSLFKTIAGAANPYLLYIKIAAVLAVALLIGSLYWYGKHEAELVHQRDQQIGAVSQQLADSQANVKVLQAANQKWADAFAEYQKAAQAQADAANSARAAEERANEELRNLEARLRSDPRATADRLNSSDDELVCMLNRASGGERVCGPQAPAATSSAAASGSAEPQAVAH